MLTLAGSGFGANVNNAGSVTVDTALCVVRLWTDSEIACTLPAGTGQAVSVLVLPEGRPSSNTVSFSYLASPPAAVPGLGGFGALLLMAMLGGVGIRNARSRAASA